MKQKTRILIYILIAAAVVILGTIAILSSRSGDKPMSAKEHLDLGRIYLNDLSYEKAVLEFTEAINIDPADPEPYIELANVYVKMDDMPKAIETLQLGADETKDEKIKEMLDKLLAEEEKKAVAASETTASTVTEPKTVVTTKPITSTASETAIEMTEVPKLAGLGVEEAKKLCEDLGLKFSISYAESSDVEKDFVIEQTIPAGTSVAKGVSVPFTVSEGSAFKVEVAAENLEFDYLANFEESGWAFAVKGTKAGYVNINGQYVEVYDDVHKLNESGIYDGLYCAIESAGVDSLYYVNGMTFATDNCTEEGDGVPWYISPFKVNEDGIYPYCNGGKWGYANINTGKIVIPCQYNRVSYMNCGRCFVIYDDPSYDKDISKETSIDPYDGVPLIDRISGKMLDMSGNEIAVNNVVLPSYNPDEHCFLNNVAMFRGKLIDINGNIIDDNIQYCPNEMWNTKYFEESGILTYICDLDVSTNIYDTYTWNTVFINEDGNQLCSLNGQYNVLCMNKHGYAVCSYNRVNGYFTKYAIIDCKNGGKIIGQYDMGDYTWLNTAFSDKLIARGIDDSIFTLFDINGNRVFKNDYEFVGNPSNDIISVKKNNKWGFVDINENMVIDYIFNDVYYFFKDNNTNDLFYLCENNIGPCWIDKKGNVVYQYTGTVEYVSKVDEKDYVIINNDGKYSIYKITL